MTYFRKTVMEWETEGRRRTGRPLGTWMDGIRYSMEKYGLRIEDTTSRERRMEKKDFPVGIPVRIV
jgi:hypothetical protein